jgi:hypothetical protein
MSLKCFSVIRSKYHIYDMVTTVKFPDFHRCFLSLLLYVCNLLELNVPEAFICAIHTRA